MIDTRQQHYAGLIAIALGAIAGLCTAYFLQPKFSPFGNELMALAITTLVSGIAAAVAGIASYYLVHTFGLVGMPQRHVSGRVVAKEYTPEKTETRILYLYNAATKTPLPTPVPHTTPEDYALEIDLDAGGGRHRQSVSREEFVALEVGEGVRSYYRISRFSGETVWDYVESSGK